MGLLIVLNNYLHDMATGVFIASAVVMWALASASPPESRVPDRVFRALQTALLVSIGWILLGGVPRAVFFPRYEFVPAVVKGLTVALVVKHVLMFLGAGAGLFAWSRARAALRKGDGGGETSRAA